MEEHEVQINMRMIASQLYAIGYQDGMQGTAPRSDQANYLDGYLSVQKDRESGFDGLSTESLFLGSQ